VTAGLSSEAAGGQASVVAGMSETTSGGNLARQQDKATQGSQSMEASGKRPWVDQQLSPLVAAET
jgi:hypothetical protein